MSVKGWPCIAGDALGIAADMWAVAASARVRAAGAGGGGVHGGGG